MVELSLLDSKFLGSFQYKIEEKPFASGMIGDVYKATVKFFDKSSSSVHCAAKKIQLSKIANAENMIFPTTRSAFREIFHQIYAAHPAVLPIVGWSMSRGDILIFTEMMNRNLSDQKYERETDADIVLDATERSIIVYGVARGMRHLHRLSILHRDLKKDNILLDEYNRPYIRDLGMAKVLEESQRNTEIGTKWHLDPDVSTGKYGYASDMYSFALMAFELWGNCDVVESMNCEQVHFSGKMKAGERPEIGPEFTEKQRELIERMWHPIAKHRPSFSEIVDLLGTSDYWVPGTDPVKFGEYVEMLDEKEQVPLIDNSEWVNSLLCHKDTRDGSTDRDYLVANCAKLYSTGDVNARIIYGLLCMMEKDFSSNTYQAVNVMHDIARDKHIDLLINALRKDGSAVEKGHWFMNNGDLAQAAKMYEEAALTGDIDAVVRLGVILLHTGDVDKGIELLTIAGEQNDFYALYTLGDYYYNISNYKLAMDAFIKCTAAVEEYDMKKTHCPHPYYKLAATYLQLDRIEEAKEVLSLLQADNGDLDEAATARSLWQKLNPRAPATRWNFRHF